MAKETPQDPYIWLEDVDGEKALDWVRTNNDRTLKRLEADPKYASFVSEAGAILTATDRIPYGASRGGYIYNFWQDKVHVRGIWRRCTAASYGQDAPAWETLLDIDALAKTEGKNWVYKGVDCLEPDNKRCLVKLSDGGKDATTIREFDLEKRAFVADGFVLPEAKTGVNWIDKDYLLVGTDWGKGSLTKSGYPRVLKRWRRGTPLADARVIFEGEADDMGVWPWVDRGPEGTVVLIYRALTFFTSELYSLEGEKMQQKFALQPSAKTRGIFRNSVLVSLREAWTVGEKTYPAGALVALPLNALRQGKVGQIDVLFEPTSTRSVASVSITKDHVYVAVLDTVKSVLLRYAKTDKGWVNSRVELPKTGTIRVVSSNAFESDVYVNYEDFKTPDALMHLKEDAKPRTIKSLPARFAHEGVTVEQRFATSKDGTKVPYFFVTKQTNDDDSKRAKPTLLYGYGGFEISLQPSYMATFGKLWLERGGSFVIANIRGGGEFGPSWHAAARKENRQRAFDDFLAVAKHLIETKVTTPEQLGIMGGSNGGLLVGAAFTQAPSLFGAVVCQVPLLDMMRYTKLLAGASWAAEYGDPSDPKMAQVIRQYSPYHNLKKGVKYPEVFFITSTRDDRVHPGHARKMAAKMQGLGAPYLYYENMDGGHAASANQNQRAKRTALEFVYLWNKLGPSAKR